MDIKILFEDEDIIVIDKPSGVIVNRADTTKNTVTIQEWAEEKINIDKNRIPQEQDSDFYKRGGVVHRLDKETSGALILAKNETSFIALQKSFKEGRVEKKYTALVHGMVMPKTGEINVPIGRLPWNRMRFGVLPEGRESRTLYNVVAYKKNLKKKENLTLIEAYPKTGRTHQIRVHMQYLGFPLFGDPLYAGRKTARDDRKFLQRHFLHASEISFPHPNDGKDLKIISPLPEELQNLLNGLEDL